MLILKVMLDSESEDESANYDVEVLLNTKTIWNGRVEKHKRSDGWAVLVQKIVEEYKAEPEIMHHIKESNGFLTSKLDRCPFCDKKVRIK